MSDPFSPGVFLYIVRWRCLTEARCRFRAFLKPKEAHAYAKGLSKRFAVVEQDTYEVSEEPPRFLGTIDFKT